MSYLIRENEIEYDPKQTLIINLFHSKCGNCGFDADPSEKSHRTRLGYFDNGQPGCGVVWKFVTSEYTGQRESILKMRPDLTWAGDQL
jgi:hypothetical protein